jgi:D-glycero-D-manno-heptose 1,7-bisphosphate phosphatase
MLKKFNKNNVEILDVFHCPHGPESNCYCRKPMPGMLLKAKDKYNIDMMKSWMIGDKDADIVSANKSGISNTILVRSGHAINQSTSNAKFILDSIRDSKKIIVI